MKEGNINARNKMQQWEMENRIGALNVQNSAVC